MVSVALAAGASSVTAQQSRARTLVFDSSTRNWEELTPPPRGTPEGEIYAAREMIRDREYRGALDLLDRLVDAQSLPADISPRAQLARAEAMIGLKRFEDAHETLDAMLSDTKDPTLVEEALRLDHVVAEAFLNGAKRKVVGLQVLPARQMGYDILEDIATEYGDTRMAEQAIKTKADYYFADGDYLLAELEYARLAQDFPNGRFAQLAWRRSADAARASFEGAAYDAAALGEARERYEEYRRRYPEAAAAEGVDAILDSIREARAEKEFEIGRYYEQTGQLKSAVFYYRFVADTWPGTVAGARALRRLRMFDAGG